MSRLRQVFYVVSKESQGWKGGKGHVNKDMLKKGLPSPSDDTLILVTFFVTYELALFPREICS